MGKKNMPLSELRNANVSYRNDSRDHVVVELFEGDACPVDDSGPISLDGRNVLYENGLGSQYFHCAHHREERRVLWIIASSGIGEWGLSLDSGAPNEQF